MPKCEPGYQRFRLLFFVVAVVVIIIIRKDPDY
jgi:hypothetical protein